MIDIGINTYLFTSPFTTSDIPLFKKLKKWGFDAVEIAIEDATHVNIKELKDALEANELRCCAVSGAFGPGRDLRGTVIEQNNSLAYLLSLIDIASEIQCPLVVGPLCSRVGRAEATEPDEYTTQWETVCGHLKTIGEYSQRSNVKIAIEPLNRYETDFLNSCAQAMALIHDADHSSLGILLDTYHMNIEEKYPEKAILLAGDKLLHFHASGCDRGQPGRDNINWAGIAKSLQTINYRGSVVIESFNIEVKVIADVASIWRPNEPSQQDVAIHGLHFLRNLLKK